MGEDHSKYMPHHPKPKFADGGKPSLQDPMIRARTEPTSHDGSGDYNTTDGQWGKWENAAY